MVTGSGENNAGSLLPAGPTSTSLATTGSGSGLVFTTAVEYFWGCCLFVYYRLQHVIILHSFCPFACGDADSGTKKIHLFADLDATMSHLYTWFVSPIPRDKDVSFSGMASEWMWLFIRQYAHICK